MTSEKQVLLVLQSGKGYKAIIRQFEIHHSTAVYKWRANRQQLPLFPGAAPNSIEGADDLGLFCSHSTC